MKLIKPIIIITALIFSFQMVGIASANNSPTEALSLSIDSILDTLRDKTLDSPDKKEERREKIRGYLNERFDFAEMGKRSLAKHWKKRTDEEKKEFIDLFSDLLEASYIGKIEGYTDEKITYDSEKIKGKGRYSVVATSIVTAKVDIPIDYKLINRKNTWRVYDVTIEGVSFVSTYRSQYDEIITKESFPKLIEYMKNKLGEVKAAL